MADLWMHHMRKGDFAAAWAVSDQLGRPKDWDANWRLPRHQQAVWNGQPLHGHVLVRCYHGLGDTVQFIRFVAELRRRVRRVIVWAQPELVPLLGSAPGIDALLPLHDGTPDVAFDCDAEVMELPYVFRTTLATLPRDVPYLHVPAQSLPRTGRRRVGLVWSAGGWDSRRSLPLDAVADLAKTPGLDWYVLQAGPARADWNLLQVPAAGWGSPKVLETAAIMRGLDLVITVDSFPAHLAGALAVPTWLLLHAEADWRWLEHSPTSPWYPTLELFRQKEPGDWRGVIQEVRVRLLALESLPKLAPQAEEVSGARAAGR